jgi:hypothetical protein
MLLNYCFHCCVVCVKWYDVRNSIENWYINLIICNEKFCMHAGCMFVKLYFVVLNVIIKHILQFSTDSVNPHTNACECFHFNLFDVITKHILHLKMRAFWDIVPCSLRADWHFRGAYCLHHQGYEMSVYSETAWRYIPEASHLHTRCHEKLISNIFCPFQLTQFTHTHI